jgi:hypothetical protein
MQSTAGSDAHPAIEASMAATSFAFWNERRSFAVAFA